MNTIVHEEILRACTARDVRALLGLALDAAAYLMKPEAHAILLNLDRHVLLEMGSETETAAITRDDAGFRMILNPEFFATFHTSGEEVLHSVLHELIHRIQGDLHRPRSQERPFIRNFACDLLVNRELWYHVFRRGLPYFLRLYPRDRFPLNILLGPDQLLTTEPGCIEGITRKKLESEARKIFSDCDGATADLANRAAHLYAEVWKADPTFEWLSRELGAMFPADMRILFLGFHGPCQKTFPYGSPLRPLGSFLGGGQGDSQWSEDERTHPKMRASAAFSEAIRKALAPDPRLRRRVVRIHPEKGVVPAPGRREAFLISAGVDPIFYPNPISMIEPHDHAVRLYIDVSGSMQHIWGFVYGMILHLRAEMAEPFYLFSNAVIPVTVSELEKGIVKTTHGTDFDCVARHALEGRFRRILVITDGDASLSPALGSRLLQTPVEVFQVLSRPGNEGGLKNVLKQSWKVPIEAWQS